MNVKELVKDLNASDIIKAQIPLVKKIINDETWYEGERRHAPVAPDDTAVREKVLDIITRNGDKILTEAIMSVKTTVVRKCLRS